MFVVNPTRKHTIPYNNGLEGDDNITFTVTFDFPYAEDMDVAEIRRRLAGVDISNLDEVSKTQDESKLNSKDVKKTSSFLFYILRSSIVSCTDIIDLEKKPLKPLNEDGSVNEPIQKAIFEAVKSCEGMLDKIIIAYMGEKRKNLKPGVTQP